MAAVALDLEALRKSLVRQEDTIIFSLIERAKYPINSRLYDDDVAPPPSSDDSSATPFKFFLNESEALQAKIGRYTSLEENAFSLDKLPPSLLPPLTQPPVLHPRAALVNINDRILDLYLKTWLPLITVEGDDGHYAPTLSSDLNCLQAISRRIHFGKFVAEIKFQEAPQDYTPAIRAKDRDALMKLLTFASVEEMVKKRVEKKAMVFGQNVELYENGGSSNSGTCKIDPSAVSRLYAEWVIPLTKLVEVEYLLRRLD